MLRLNGKRYVAIPEDFVLEGEEIAILQEKWGEIVIYPASPKGIEALEPFNPFYWWTEEDEQGEGTAKT